MVDEWWIKAIVFALLGLGSGFLSGFFGIGGGIVRIPVFLWLLPLFGVAPAEVMHVAIGSSVALVIPTAIIATWKQRDSGNFDGSFFTLWGVGVFVGVVAGMIIVPWLSAEILKTVFAVFLVLVGWYVGFAPRGLVISQSPPGPPGKVGLGTLTGFFSALTGTAGGAIASPVLKTFSVPLHAAISTATATGLIVGPVSTTGMILHGLGSTDLPPFSLGYVDLLIVAFMLPTTLIGAPLGVKLNHKVAPRPLKISYTIMIVIVATSVIGHLAAH